MLRQIKADLLGTVEDHHRQHHDDWLTVTGSDTTSAVTWWVCVCCHGHTVRVGADRVLKTREIATPPPPEPEPRPSALSLLRRALGRANESGTRNGRPGP